MRIFWQVDFDCPQIQALFPPKDLPKVDVSPAQKISFTSHSIFNMLRLTGHYHCSKKMAPTMDKDTLDFFRNLLREQLNSLLLEAGITVKAMSGKEELFPDPVDRASLESDRNFLLRIRDRERKLIVKIEQALERIQDGSFGVCERCGADISAERLKARPVTTLCIDCKQEQENQEKLLGA
jgi:DnaK suppressor protein